MSMKRRDFLKAAVAGGALCATGAGAAEARREAAELPPDAVGMLYDSTLCIGCKACVSACRQANGLGPEMGDETLAGWNPGLWDTPVDLSAKTWNVIKAYRHGTMEAKDRAENGFAFVKRHCLHCVDPSCVSACPVTAMIKDPKTGVVTHNPDACIGCRYCVYSCPFGVPRYDYDDPFGKIGKCQFCDHLQADGKTPACCHVCPTGATLFGRVDDLKAEAKRRLALQPGETTEFPRGNLSGKRAFAGRDGHQPKRTRDRAGRGDKPRQARLRQGKYWAGETSHEQNDGHRQSPHEAAVADYHDRHLYGESELGGTQVMYLSGVPFDRLGLPTDVPDHAYAAETEGIQHTLYKGMIAPVALLAGLATLTYRASKKHNEEDDQ